MENRTLRGCVNLHMEIHNYEPLCRQHSVVHMIIWCFDLSPRLNDMVGMIILLVIGLAGSFLVFVSEIIMGGKIFEPANNKKRVLLCTTGCSCYKMLCNKALYLLCK